jgi:hypothetical protein
MKMTTTIKSLYITEVTYQMAQNIVSYFLCSQCWGHLVARPTDTGVMVLCGSCGEETKGYVSKRYVERRQQESQVERIDAKIVLKSVIKSPLSGKSTDQLLQDLGYQGGHRAN